jgi:O-antigen/teichoic acid export membrane protein
MVLIRQLSKAEMGTWALFLTITTLFEATKSGLLKNAHIMFVSATSDDEEKSAIASSSFIINLCITIFFIIFILIFSNWLAVRLHAGAELAEMLKWFIPGLICMVLFSHFEAIQQSFLDFKGVFAGYLLRQFVFFAIIISYLFLHKSFSLKYLAIYQSVSIFFGTVIIYLYTRKYLSYRFNVQKKWIKKIFGYGKYIFGSGLISNIFVNFDQLMTATFMSSFYVSYYNVALRINNFMDIPSYAAAQIVFPKAVKASVEEGREKVKYLYERISGVLLSFTFPMALFIIIFPKFVITIIAGAQYADAVPILQLYMIINLINPMQNQAANTLNSIGKAQLVFKLDAISLLMNLCINYVCLSIWGFYGAAIGTFITCVINSFIWYFTMKKLINLHLPNVYGHIIGSYKMVYAEAVNILKGRKA